MQTKHEKNSLEKLFFRIEQATKVKGTGQLAKKLGVEPGAVSNWKKGRNRPNYEAIFALCESHEINFHWLLTGQGKMLLKDMRDMSKKEEIFLGIGKRLHEVWGLLQALDENSSEIAADESGDFA